MNSPNHPKAKFLDRTTAPHIATLVLVSGLAALTMNFILPSLPAMAAYFETDYAVIQLSISAYLGLTGLLQLFIGPLSDRYGRRPVLLWSFGIFCLATLATVFATNITIVMIFRLIQAVVATGIVLSRAIVRDLVHPSQAASMIGYVTMGMSLMPMLGPVLGGTLQEMFGWRVVFFALFAFGVLVLIIVFFDLKETNAAKSASFREQFRLYPTVFKSRRFWGYSATIAFASGCFFCFLGGGPYVAVQILHMSAQETGFSFGIIAAGYLAGNFFSGRYSERAGLMRMMKAGTVITTLGVLLSLILQGVGMISVWSIFAPIFFVGFGNGLTMPSGNAGLLSVRPEIAGTVSGLGGALMITSGAVLSAATAAVLSWENVAYLMAIMMLVSSIISMLAVFYTGKVERQVAAAA